MVVVEQKHGSKQVRFHRFLKVLTLFYAVVVVLIVAVAKYRKLAVVSRQNTAGQKSNKKKTFLFEVGLSCFVSS